jgi:LPXTG-motif cell wall-anchored protein
LKDRDAKPGTYSIFERRCQGCPAGPAPDTDEEFIIEEEDIPAGALPKTGGIPAVLLFGIGALLVGGGLMLRRRENKVR